jgi:hypothetical protein
VTSPSSWRRRPPAEHDDSDPLAGVANLFDVSVVFIVGLMVALFGTFRLQDLIDPRSEVTLVKTNATGEREILIKKGRKVTSYKVGRQAGEGKGKRLGSAYQLESGQMIYVPEEGDQHVEP